MIVDICGIPHTIIECEDRFDTDLHFGMVDYAKAEIRINKNISDSLKGAILCHEIMHGILVHIGREDLSQDEIFVSNLGNAIFQTYKKGLYENDSNK